MNRSLSLLLDSFPFPSRDVSRKTFHDEIGRKRAKKDEQAAEWVIAKRWDSSITPSGQYEISPEDACRLDSLPTVVAEFLRTIASNYEGSRGGYGPSDLRWIPCGWYISYHTHSENWGIHIQGSCLERLRIIIRNCIVHESRERFGWLEKIDQYSEKSEELGLLAAHSAFQMVFEHEYYHFRFNILLDHIQQIIDYQSERSQLRDMHLCIDYLNQVYAKDAITNHGADEEAAATFVEYEVAVKSIRTAVALVQKNLNLSSKEPPVAVGQCSHLEQFLDESPPGYNRYMEVNNSGVALYSTKVIEKAIASLLDRKRFNLGSLRGRLPLLIHESHLGPKIPVYFH